jgi:hypothetical protein
MANTSAPRILTPRKMIGEHQKEEFEYPFAESGFEEKHIPHVVSKPLGDFPNNIKRWIWSSAGENDGDSWELIAELEPEPFYDGKRYVYYTAWCDYTGFDCRGYGETFVTSKIEYLIEYALGNAEYDRYIKETEPAEEW